MVFESVPAPETIYSQLGRLCDDELRSHPGNHDSGSDCRELATVSHLSSVKNQAFPLVRCCPCFHWASAGCNRHLPERETDLDTLLGALEWRMLLYTLGDLFRVARCWSSRRLGISAQSDRRQLNSGLCRFTPDRRIYP